MESWIGTARASEDNLAHIQKVDTSIVAMVATGHNVNRVQAALTTGTFDARQIDLMGEYAILERGAAHVVVRVSDKAMVMLRDPEGYLETISGDTQMFPLETVESAALVLGVPKERLQRHTLEGWLKRGVPDGAIDKLVAAWADYAVVIVESFDRDQVADPNSTHRLTDAPTPESTLRSTIPPRDADLGTIPPPALLTGSPLAPKLMDMVREAAAAPPEVETPTPPTPVEPSEPSDAPETPSAPAAQDPRIFAALGAFAVLAVALVIGALYLWM